MAILSQEEFMQAVQEIVGENTDDNSLAFVENMTDTYNNLSERANPNGVNWEERYRQNDEEWRNKYKERFFSTEGEPPTPPTPPTPKKLTFENLFKEGE